MTKKQKEILIRMNNGDELTYCKGSGWWIENDRTNGKLVFALLRKMAISQDSYFDDSKDYQIFYINETGRKMFINEKA